MSTPNPVTWIIQTNLIALDQVQEIWEAAVASGSAVQEAIVIPFQDELGNEDAIPHFDGVVIPYGSCKMNKLAEARAWRGTCYDEQTFRADVWNQNRSDMLNQDCVVMTVEQTPEFFKDIPDDELRFIRPLFDLKEFAGTVCEVAEIKKWMSSTKSGNFSFTKDTPVAISTLKDIHGEARVFVVDGRVTEASWYRQNGRLLSTRIQDPALLSAFQDLADIWLPHVCCVMDIAQTDEGLKVIEFNTINSSGFYACNITNIVNAMTKWGQDLPLENTAQRVAAP